MTRGGRGGPVIAVTNLDDSGPGSLRAAVEAEGPRIIVFRVSGTIILESPLKISNPFVTIAGQTAPGDGVAVRDHPIQIDADEVVIRYLRVRLGDESGGDDDAISSRYHKNIILDHLSASWSIDEAVSLYHGENVTVQWCLISESLYESNHVKGHHGFGGIWGSNYSSLPPQLAGAPQQPKPSVRFRLRIHRPSQQRRLQLGHQQRLRGREADSKATRSSVTVSSTWSATTTSPVPRRFRERCRASYRRTRRRADEADDFAKWFVAENFMHGESPLSRADNWNGGRAAAARPIGHVSDELRLVGTLAGDADPRAVSRRSLPWRPSQCGRDLAQARRH